MGEILDDKNQGKKRPKKLAENNIKRAVSRNIIRAKNSHSNGRIQNEGAPNEAINPRKRSCLGTVIAIFGVLISVLWLMNLGLGVVGEIPDNIPFFGNLDEAFFTTLFWASLTYLGLKK